MFEQFNMERIIRDARYGKLRHKDGRKLTHLEQLEIADPADEGWHARYGRLAAQIANSHKPEDK